MASMGRPTRSSTPPFTRRTGSMITIITKAGAKRGRRAVAGFTLTEVLIALGISSIIMGAILTSFFQMTKSGLTAYNYVDMEQEARRGLEQFGEDVRQAYQATWTSAQDVTLYMGGTTADATKDVRYYYDSATGTFRRNGPDRVTGVITNAALINNVQNDFAFTRWYRGVPPTSSLTDARTWQLQLSLTIKKQVNEFGVKTMSTIAATNLVVSA